MTATAALQQQINRYRRMTGEQRLKIALDLHELSCNIAREGIRRQHPGATEGEVEQILRLEIESERELKPTREALAKIAAQLTSASEGAVADKDFKL